MGVSHTTIGTPASAWPAVNLHKIFHSQIYGGYPLLLALNFELRPWADPTLSTFGIKPTKATGTTGRPYPLRLLAWVFTVRRSAMRCY